MCASLASGPAWADPEAVASTTEASPMKPNTHLGIDARLCGAPVSLAEGTATVRFEATPDMAVDDRGLVHGGFVFGLADHAAMLAVNDPLVVLGGAEVRFTAPVAVGQTVDATATVTATKGRRATVAVEARVGDRVVLDRHVLD
jgi:acyl-coenzyme A thioesterase PaaI-like protein